MGRCKMHIVGTLRMDALRKVLDSLGVENKPNDRHPNTLLHARMPLERLQNLRWAVEDITTK